MWNTRAIVSQPADADVVAENIKDSIDIYGVVGSLSAGAPAWANLNSFASLDLYSWDKWSSSYQIYSPYFLWLYETSTHIYFFLDARSISSLYLHEIVIYKMDKSTKEFTRQIKWIYFPKENAGFTVVENSWVITFWSNDYDSPYHFFYCRYDTSIDTWTTSWTTQTGAWWLWFTPGLWSIDTSMWWTLTYYFWINSGWTLPASWNSLQSTVALGWDTYGCSVRGRADYNWVVWYLAWLIEITKS